MRWLWLILLCTAVAFAGPGGPKKDRVVVASGTAAIGAYTFPGNFTDGLAIRLGMDAVGIELTRDAFTNTTAEIELVVELSFNGGVTWPPPCLPPPATVCHDATQSMPEETGYQAIKTTSEPAAGLLTWAEMDLAEPANATRRLRGRMIVRNASVTGEIRVLWYIKG
jgi:hypothetical protein